MGAPVTLSTSAWTEVAAAGFKKAVVKGGKYAIWLELASSLPSSGSASLGVQLAPRDSMEIETGDASLALYARFAETGASGSLQVLPVGAPSFVTAETSGLQVSEVTFTETSGAGTYTGSVAIPAGAALHDVIVNGVALWDNAGAVTMTVGDATDPDGYYTAVNLKATDLLAGESISFDFAGGKAGAYIANSQVSPRYSASARTISGIITTASTGGSAGRTRMSVVWSAPPAARISAATKA